ncbi:hypothetical protein BV881_16450 [Streptomyces sp. ZL-24]|nr:hypothetical protein BV881_16450 [Streptomyces sp. ZL-24]
MRGGGGIRASRPRRGAPVHQRGSVLKRRTGWVAAGRAGMVRAHVLQQTGPRRGSPAGPVEGHRHDAEHQGARQP